MVMVRIHRNGSCILDDGRKNGLNLDSSYHAKGSFYVWVLLIEDSMSWILVEEICIDFNH